MDLCFKPIEYETDSKYFPDTKLSELKFEYRFTYLNLSLPQKQDKIKSDKIKSFFIYLMALVSLGRFVWLILRGG